MKNGDAIMKKELIVKDMHCTSCSKLIEDAVMKLKGVRGIKVSYVNEKAEVNFDESKLKLDEIINTINELGYSATEKNEEGKKGFIDKIFGR